MTTHRDWTHDSVFRALRSRFGGRPTKSGDYAYLYEGQETNRRKPNSAVLYEPASRMSKRYLHLRPGSPTARQSILDGLEPFIALQYQETSEKKSTRFDWYTVTDWNAFARVVELPPSPS